MLCSWVTGPESVSWSLDGAQVLWGRWGAAGDGCKRSALPMLLACDACKYRTPPQPLLPPSCSASCSADLNAFVGCVVRRLRDLHPQEACPVVCDGRHMQLQVQCDRVGELAEEVAAAAPGGGKAAGGRRD